MGGDSVMGSFNAVSRWDLEGRIGFERHSGIVLEESDSSS